MVDHQDGNYPGTDLPHSQRALSKELPFAFDIHSKHGNLQLYFSHQLLVRRRLGGTNLQVTAKKKAKIGQFAAKRRVLAMVQDFTTKLPVPLTNSGLGIEPQGSVKWFQRNF